MRRAISSLGLERIGKKTQRRMRTASTSGAWIMITMFSPRRTSTVSRLWNPDFSVPFLSESKYFAWSLSLQIHIFCEPA